MREPKLLYVAIAVIVVVGLLWGWPGWMRGSSSAPNVAISQTVESRPTSGPVAAIPVVPTPPSIPPADVALAGQRGKPVVRPVKVGRDMAPAINAPMLVVIDEGSGQVLYGVNEHQRAPMASITKIATAVVALERGNLDKVVEVDYDPTELYDSTAMGCNPGEYYTLRDLLYGLMLPSGNDAALAIATEIGGSKQKFVQMMNDKARELGLTNTHFMNPHGLHEDEHYTSAYDIAMFARYGMMTDETFRDLAAAVYYDIHGSKSYRIYNLNRLLWGDTRYELADGVKIGYTEQAGRTTVASATKDGHRVYVAALNVGDTVGDIVPIFEWVWATYQWQDVSGR